jgi:hypothetical protein
VSLDAAWNCDATARAVSSKMATFFNNKGTYGIQQGFKSDCSTINYGDSRCFIAMAAAAMVPSMASGVVSTWFSATMYTYAGQGYFCDCLQMLSLTFQAGLLTLPSV